MALKASTFTMTDHSSHETCGDGWTVSMFLETPRQDLLCGICEQVARFAVETDCGHTYCHCCLLTWVEKRQAAGQNPTCPVDQNVIDIRACSLAVKDESYIRESTVQCPMGCNNEMELKWLMRHQDQECPKRSVRCDACAQDMPYCELADHMRASMSQHILALLDENKALKSQVDTLKSDLREMADANDLAVDQLIEAKQELESVTAQYAGRFERLEEYLRSRVNGGDDSMFPGSSILDARAQNALGALHAEDCQWRLAFKGSTDGLSSQVFHQKCDALAGTMVVVKGVDGGVCGGFASIAWGPADSKTDSWTDDPGAYLFLLAKGSALRLDPKSLHHFSIRRDPALGPAFGSSSSHQVLLGSNGNMSSFSLNRARLKELSRVSNAAYILQDPQQAFPDTVAEAPVAVADVEVFVRVVEEY